MLRINNRGFTLIELLVVIAIIGILVAVGTVSYQRAVQLSRDSKRKTDLEQIRQALETYRSEIGSYPSTNTWEADLVPDYISSIPSDPKSNEYVYAAGAGVLPTTYTLCAALEKEPTSPACTSTSCGTVSCNYQTTSP